MQSTGRAFSLSEGLAVGGATKHTNLVQPRFSSFYGLYRQMRPCWILADWLELGREREGNPNRRGRRNIRRGDAQTIPTRGVDGKRLRPGASGGKLSGVRLKSRLTARHRDPKAATDADQTDVFGAPAASQQRSGWHISQDHTDARPRSIAFARMCNIARRTRRRPKKLTVRSSITIRAKRGQQGRTAWPCRGSEPERLRGVVESSRFRGASKLCVQKTAAPYNLSKRPE